MSLSAATSTLLEGNPAPTLQFQVLPDLQHDQRLSSRPFLVGRLRINPEQAGVG